MSACIEQKNKLKFYLENEITNKLTENINSSIILIADKNKRKTENLFVCLLKKEISDFEIIVIDKYHNFDDDIIKLINNVSRIKYYLEKKSESEFVFDEALRNIRTKKVLIIKAKDYEKNILIDTLNKNLIETPYVNYYKKGKITTEIKSALLKIDLVYTWVDSSDEKWIEKKSKYDETIKKCNKDAVDKCRFQNNDELKYSLRSVSKFAPWINNIYILTDDQKPEWLNLNNPKIKIVSHRDVIPNEKLPTYNACTIENAIPYIKGLSEHYLYANDDMMFFSKTSPEFFFKNGLPIVRIKERIKKYKKYNHLYGSMVYKAYSLAKERFNKDYPYFSHHNIDSYLKSQYLDCISEFKEEFDRTISNRFRDFSDMQRMIVSYYALAKNKAILKDTNLNIFQKIFNITSDSEYLNVRKNTLNKISKIKTHLICLNDCRKTTDKDREFLKQIMKEKFGDKSEFEV